MDRTECQNYAHICQGRGGKIENGTHAHTHTHDHSIPTENGETDTTYVSGRERPPLLPQTAHVEREGGDRKEREAREEITFIPLNTDEEGIRRGATHSIYERQW